MPEHIMVPVSAGELLDKKTILEIKRERIKDPVQRANVERELDLLETLTRANTASFRSAAVVQLEGELRDINAEIWDLENAVRACERSGTWGDEFVQTARRIYASNDRRAALKKRINLLLDSSIIEEKSHG